MLKQRILDDLADRFAELIAASPARDLEKNAKAMLTATLAKLDVVTREEFDVQQAVLVRTREALQQLEARVVALESAQNLSKPQD